MGKKKSLLIPIELSRGLFGGLLLSLITPFCDPSEITIGISIEIPYSHGNIHGEIRDNC